MSEPPPPREISPGARPLPSARAAASWVNLSGAERVLRILVGAAMLGATWTGAVAGIAGVALQIFGWVPLATGVVGWCPFYAIFGLSTCRHGTRTGGRRERSPSGRR
jgi:predicted exporter